MAVNARIPWNIVVASLLLLPVGLAAAQAPFFGASLVYASSSGMESIPQLTASCPTGVSFQSTQGGPALINGEEASVKVFNANYFEAKRDGITVSVSRTDGAYSVSYSIRGEGNGYCQIVDEKDSGQTEQPSRVDTPGAAPR